MTLTDKQELARLLTLYQQEMIEHNEANIAERKKHENRCGQALDWWMPKEKQEEIKE